VWGSFHGLHILPPSFFLCVLFTRLPGILSLLSFLLIYFCLSGRELANSSGIFCPCSEPLGSVFSPITISCALSPIHPFNGRVLFVCSRGEFFAFPFAASQSLLDLSRIRFELPYFHIALRNESFIFFFPHEFILSQPFTLASLSLFIFQRRPDVLSPLFQV